MTQGLSSTLVNISYRGLDRIVVHTLARNLYYLWFESVFVFDVPVGKIEKNRKTKKKKSKVNKELSDSDRESLCFHAVILTLHANTVQSYMVTETTNQATIEI